MRGETAVSFLVSLQTTRPICPPCCFESARMQRVCEQHHTEKAGRPGSGAAVNAGRLSFGQNSIRLQAGDETVGRGRRNARHDHSAGADRDAETAPQWSTWEFNGRRACTSTLPPLGGALHDLVHERGRSGRPAKTPVRAT